MLTLGASWYFLAFVFYNILEVSLENADRLHCIVYTFNSDKLIFKVFLVMKKFFSG